MPGNVRLDVEFEDILPRELKPIGEDREDQAEVVEGEGEEAAEPVQEGEGEQDVEQ